MLTRRSFRVAAFACAAGLVGVACGGANAPVPDAAPADTTTNTTTDTSADAGAVVPASLQFTAPLVGGGEFVGDELAGKPTAFWFWSPT